MGCKNGDGVIVSKNRTETASRFAARVAAITRFALEAIPDGPADLVAGEAGNQFTDPAEAAILASFRQEAFLVIRYMEGTPFGEYLIVNRGEALPAAKEGARALAYAPVVDSSGPTAGAVRHAYRTAWREFVSRTQYYNWGKDGPSSEEVASTFEDVLRADEDWREGNGTGCVVSPSEGGGYTAVTELLAELRDAVLLRRAAEEMELSDETGKFQARAEGWDVPEGTVHLYSARFIPSEGTRVVVFHLPGPNPEDGSPFFGRPLGTHWVLEESGKGYRVLQGLAGAGLQEKDEEAPLLGPTPEAAIAAGLLWLAARYERAAEANEGPLGFGRTDPRRYRVLAEIARGLITGRQWPEVYGLPEEVLATFGR